MSHRGDTMQRSAREAAWFLLGLTQGMGMQREGIEPPRGAGHFMAVAGAACDLLEGKATEPQEVAAIMSLADEIFDMPGPGE